MCLTEEDFERMRRMRNTKSNGILIDTAPAHPEYRRKKGPNTLQYVMSRRGGLIALGKMGPIGLQKLKRHQ